MPSRLEVGAVRGRGDAGGGSVGQSGHHVLRVWDVRIWLFRDRGCRSSFAVVYAGSPGLGQRPRGHAGKDACYFLLSCDYDDRSGADALLTASTTTPTTGAMTATLETPWR